MNQTTEPTEHQLITEIDERTDRTRRSVLATLGNTLLFLAFVALPHLDRAAAVVGDFAAHQSPLLALPGLTCVASGAFVYRWLGPKHRLYLTLDAIELVGLHGFPALFPLLAESTATLAGVSLVVSAAFWGQGKPGRARLYGVLVGILAAIPVVVLLARGHFETARVSGSFGFASILAYVMSVRFRLEVVRSELRRNRLRTEERALLVARERHRIEQELTDHVGAQLESLVAQLTRAGLNEATTAKRLVGMLSELVFPASQPVQVVELSELTFNRCRALCPGVRLQYTAPSLENDVITVSAASARAVLRIAQELVRNSVVHGRANLVDVVLSENGPGLRLTVSDDGVGLSETTAQAASGGLANVKTWAAETGGTMRLEPKAGFSTSIGVTLAGTQVPEKREDRPAEK